MRTYTAHSVDLNPNYDVELFRNIAMPPGMRVHIIKGGEIVETQIDGVAERTESRFGKRPTNYASAAWLAIGSLLVVSVLVIFWLKRRGAAA